MFLIAAAVAAEAATAPGHPEAPHPWYVDPLIDFGGWAVLAALLLAFVKYALPKIVKAITAAFATMRADYKETLTDTTTQFTGSLKEQREAFAAERALDRDAQRESTVASHNTAVAMASLSNSMDNFSTELRDLPDRIRRATVKTNAPTQDELQAAREAKVAKEAQA